MIVRNFYKAALVSASLIVSAAAIPAYSQETMEAPVEAAPPVETAPAASYDDAKLRSFVVAFLQVDEVNRTYAPQLQEAEGSENEQAVRDEAGQQMVQAVEQTEGISVEEYGTIIQQAQTDPALAQQINDYIQETVGQPAAE